jgi:hypothetical protein
LEKVVLTKQQLIALFQQKAVDSPYIIELTPNGFNVKLNIVDAKWMTIIQANGLKKTFSIEVTLDEAKHAVQTNDRMYSLSWNAGLNGALVPSIQAEVSTFSGSMMEISTDKRVGYVPGAGVGLAVNYTFNSEEARGWLNAVLVEGGWQPAASGIANLTSLKGLSGSKIIALVAVVFALIIMFGVMLPLSLAGKSVHTTTSGGSWPTSTPKWGLTP